MTRSEFKDLRIGDIVKITQHGKNREKQGVVSDIVRGPMYGGAIYLTPLNCEFQFSNEKTKSLRFKNGCYRWRYESIAYANKISKPIDLSKASTKELLKEIERRFEK